MYTIIYVLSIVAINYGFSVVPLIETPWGDLWPPMSIAVGVVFVLRDFAQREIGHKVIGAMLIGGILSYLMADPYVAIASVVAFAVSECLDWVIYTWTKKPFHQRVLLSSLFSTPIDSVVFLAMLGMANFTTVLLMTISKMVAAIVIAYLIAKRQTLATQ